MLHVDIPDRAEFATLAQKRQPGCVSIYLRTTPVTQQVEASRIEMRNLVDEAEQQLIAAEFDKRQLAALMEQLRDLLDDDDFWYYQANSLAVFATPEGIRSYRLANKLVSMVQVADRFHLKPLFRAIAFPHSAFILALSENAVRLVEMHADLPATRVEVPGLPADLNSMAGPTAVQQRSFSGRIKDPETHNTRLQQYARRVDHELRSILAGREVPLVLAATGRLAAVFPQLNSYSYLLDETISTNPDRLSEAELAGLARPLLDAAYAQKIKDLHALFARRSNERRTSTDITDLARAATFGAIQTLMVDIDSVLPGFVDDDTGEVTFVAEDDAEAYGIVDEITARAFTTGAKVLALRRQDIPGGGDLAAILRYPH